MPESVPVERGGRPPVGARHELAAWAACGGVRAPAPPGGPRAPRARPLAGRRNRRPRAPRGPRPATPPVARLLAPA